MSVLILCNGYVIYWAERWFKDTGFEQPNSLKPRFKCSRRGEIKIKHIQNLKRVKQIYEDFF